MNKFERKFNQNDYQPKRFGLKYNRPGIVLEYLVPSTGKLYHHKIRLYNMKVDSNIQEVMKEIYEKHYQYLDNRKISPNQILKLVERLRMNMKQSESHSVKNHNLNNMQEEIHESSINSSNQKDSVQTDNKNSKVQINELEDEEDEDYYKFYDYENEDLNKLNLDDLKMRKEEMEVLYKKNAVLPGDDNFVFDKDFESDKYRAEWDEEEEQEEEEEEYY